MQLVNGFSECQFSGWHSLALSLTVTRPPEPRTVTSSWGHCPRTSGPPESSRAHLAPNGAGRFYNVDRIIIIITTTNTITHMETLCLGLRGQSL